MQIWLENANKRKIALVFPLVFFVSWFFSSSLIAAPLFSVDSEITQRSILPYIDILIDGAENLSVDDVISEQYIHQFAPLPNAKIHFGFNKTVYWLRFTIDNRNANEEEFLLEIAPAILDQIDLYQYDSTSEKLIWQHRSGSLLPYTEREIKHPLHLFPLKVATGKLSTYYIKINSQTSINVRLNLSHTSTFSQFNLQRSGWSSLMYGLLIALTLIQIGLLILFNKFQHALYAIFITSLLCFQAAWNGWFYQFFPTHAHLQEQLIIFFIYGATAVCVLFSRLYLNTALRNPNWDKALLILAGFSGICSVTAFFTSFSANGHIAVFHALLYTLILLGYTAYEVIQENPKALTYLFARVGSFVVIVITLVCALGLIDYPQILQYGTITCLGFEALLITLFMIYHEKADQKIALTKNNSESLHHSSQKSFTELIRKISHDIRTPMSGISGMAELLLDSSLTESQRKQVLTIKNAGDSLLNLVANLATSPGVETGAVELQNISFNLPSLISECVDIYQAQAEEKHLELISDIHYSVPKLVRGDPNRLQQILMHLLSLTFSNSREGEVVVSVRISKATNLIEFDIISTGVGNIRELESTIFATDNGDAAAPRHQQQEFNIAKQLSTLMGGKIGLEPYQVNGIKIWFTANMPALALDETTEREYDNILRKRRLLVVDDNETFRQVIQQQANSWGMQISSARSGMEALAILRSQAILEEQFDVIIVDHQMPTMNGLQLAEKIKEDPLLQPDMLVIMLTGVTNAPSTTEARSAGIRRVLTKPVSAQSLKITLAEEFAYLHSEMTNTKSTTTEHDSKTAHI